MSVLSTSALHESTHDDGLDRSLFLTAKLCIRPLNEAAYCDLCCAKLEGSVFEISCGHSFCKSCLVAIAEADRSLRGDSAEVTSLECPLCLRPSEYIANQDPFVRTKDTLCQECNSAESSVSCATCGANLCSECDARVHSFRLSASHRRSAISRCNNEDANTIEVPCQSVTHKAAATSASGFLADRRSVGASGSGSMVSSSRLATQALSTSTLDGGSVTHLCVETHELLCTACMNSSYYKDKTFVPVRDATVESANKIMHTATRIRSLVAKSRDQVHALRGLSVQNQALFNYAATDLGVIRENSLKLITARFTQLQDALRRVFDTRSSDIQAKADEVCATVRRAMDSAVSCEKHATQRQQEVFLLEFPSLFASLQREEKALAEFADGFEALSLPPYPRICGTEKLTDLVNNHLCLQDADLLVEQISAGGQMNAVAHVVLGCRVCANSIVRVASKDELKKAAVRSRGCLYGLRGDMICDNGIMLDATTGKPSAHPALCKNCGAEIGRWCEDGHVEKSFAPGLVYVSVNALSKTMLN